MFRTRVKICGITRIQDAINAIEAGADSLGFVFYPPSPRNIQIKDAAEILAALPPFVTSTALFVNADVALIRQVIEQTAIDLLQFHGEESADFCRQFGRPYIKSVSMQATTDLAKVASQYDTARALLLDTYKPGVPGGTGEQFNWSWVPKAFKKPLILAGGLNAENVATAIKQTGVYAVDVSGGVEQSKGVKSKDKMNAFIKACYQI
jgi:phosphoribosylanthranilate isomerase